MECVSLGRCGTRGRCRASDRTGVDVVEDDANGGWCSWKEWPPGADDLGRGRPPVSDGRAGRGQGGPSLRGGRRVRLLGDDAAAVPQGLRRRRRGGVDAVAQRPQRASRQTPDIVARIRRAREQGVGLQAIAKVERIARSSVVRALVPAADADTAGHPVPSRGGDGGASGVRRGGTPHCPRR